MFLKTIKIIKKIQDMVISGNDVNKGTNRQIIYNFVLDQIKHKLTKKTSRFVYNNCNIMVLKVCIFNTSIIMAVERGRPGIG